MSAAKRFDEDSYALRTPLEIGQAPIFDRLAVQHNRRVAAILNPRLGDSTDGAS